MVAYFQECDTLTYRQYSIYCEASGQMIIFFCDCPFVRKHFQILLYFPA